MLCGIGLKDPRPGASLYATARWIPTKPAIDCDLKPADLMLAHLARASADRGDDVLPGQFGQLARHGVSIAPITPSPTQRRMPLSPLYRQRSSPWRRLTTLMRPSDPVRHFWPLRNQRFFCSRLRSGLLVERLGTHTRFTPLALAAASFLPE